MTPKKEKVQHFLAEVVALARSHDLVLASHTQLEVFDRLKVPVQFAALRDTEIMEAQDRSEENH